MPLRPLGLLALALFLPACASGAPVVPPPPGDGGLPPSDSGGRCGAMQILCGEVCVDPRTDRTHCGACDDGTGAQSCGPGEICTDGACGLTCGGATPLLCGDRCVDPTADDTHCGDCETACTAVETCTAGTCTSTCAEPTPSQCGDVCTDFDVDPEHCGRCDLACATDYLCVGGVCEPPCDPGLVYCGGSCVDPLTDEMWCGASGDCTGAAAGSTCASAEVCALGVCDDTDPRSCADALAMGRSTGDGVYRVDPDGMGGSAAFDVYCDMSTDGGGWTLTYKLQNSVSSSANPWWNMVMPGSGTTFPTSMAVPAGITEGPTLATRAAYTTGTGATSWRATTVRAGTILFDMTSSYAGANGQGMRCFAAGTCTSSTQTCSPSSTDGRVLANSLPGPFTAGGTGYVCDVGWTDCSYCVDWSEVRTDTTAGGSSTNAVRYAGDSAIAITDTTTYYWVR